MLTSESTQAKYQSKTTIKEIKEDDKTIALQMIRKFGTIAAVNEAIVSLSQFLIYNRKVA